MAQGRFSQPRHHNHDEDDFEAVMRRRKQDTGRTIAPEPKQDISLDETQVLSQALLAETQILPDFPQEIPEEAWQAYRVLVDMGFDRQLAK